MRAGPGPSAHTPAPVLRATCNPASAPCPCRAHALRLFCCWPGLPPLLRWGRGGPWHPPAAAGQTRPAWRPRGTQVEPPPEQRRISCHVKPLRSTTEYRVHGRHVEPQRRSAAAGGGESGRGCAQACCAASLRRLYDPGKPCRRVGAARRTMRDWAGDKAGLVCNGAQSSSAVPIATPPTDLLRAAEREGLAEPVKQRLQLGRLQRGAGRRPRA
jgi:hypothetical protein